MSARARVSRSAVSSSSVDQLDMDEAGEEIVMTPLKARAGQILRVERVSTGLMDGRKVHYFAEGPYRGIVVNKATNVKPYKTAPETLRRFIAYIHDRGNTTKEVREIRFWFKRDTDSGDMEDFSDSFFRELIDPKDFPKDHLRFVKRVLTLTQKYQVVKFLELEIRPYTSEDDPAFDVRGQSLTSDGRPPRRRPTSASDRAVRQATSTDDLQAGQGKRRRVRRLTVSGTEKVAGGGEGGGGGREAINAVPTVFVYRTDSTSAPNDKTSSSTKKKKGSTSGGLGGLTRSEAMENLHRDDSVFQHNGTSHNHSNGNDSVPKPKVKRKSGSPPAALPRNSSSEPPAPIYGVVKPRKSRENGSVSSPVKNSPSCQSKSSYDAVDASPEVEYRKSGKRPTSGSRDSYGGREAEQKPNGPRPSSRKKTRRKSHRNSRIVSLLEDAYPTMLSIDDLASLSGMDVEDVEKELTVLSSVGVAAEVDSEMWVRSQVQRRLASTPSSEKRRSAQEVDLQKNEFRMFASAPSLLDEDQPTVAIITSLFCEKVAVDVMMNVKATYVKYKTTEGCGQVYTVGEIDGRKVVSTKLSRIVHGDLDEDEAGDETGRSETAAAEGTIARLLETFHHIEHVMLVGVGGGVADTDDDSNHVRLGDVVVTRPVDKSNPFLYFHVSGTELDETSSLTLETRPWSSKDSELRSIVGKIQKSPKKLFKQVDAFIEEATAALEANAEEFDFARPPVESDRLYRTTTTTETLAVHPEVVPGSSRDLRQGRPLVHFGAVASGRILNSDDDVRGQFCLQQKVKAVDSGFQKVLDSLENQDDLSFVIVRGISDYGDGTRHKEWQPYASLVAAAVMKCIVMRLTLHPQDEDGLV